MATWYYRKNDDEYGLATSAELKALAEAGQLLPTDLVRKCSQTSWLLAEKVRGLFPVEEPPHG